MSTKSRRVIHGGAVMRAKIQAECTPKRAADAMRIDRAEAEAWSIQIKAYSERCWRSPLRDWRYEFALADAYLRESDAALPSCHAGTGSRPAALS